MQTNQHSDWENNGNGKWTFTGDTLDNIPDDLKGQIQFVSAPKATTVELFGCREVESFEAPNATTVKLFGFSALKSFEAQNATEVVLSSYQLKSFEAPKATTVKMIGCTRLESFEAPNATEVEMSRCHKLKSLKAPKATTVELFGCRELKSFEAPNATKVKLFGCPELESFDARNAMRIALHDSNQHVQDIIIQQLKNPQNLHYFKVQRKDIAQDIKNADMELNGSERVSTLRGGIVGAMRPHTNVSENEPSKARKEVKCSQGAMSTIGYFLNPNEINCMSKLNSRAYEGSVSEICTSNIQGIKNYKEERIAQKTNAHTDMKNAQTTGRVRSDVPVGFGY